MNSAYSAPREHLPLVETYEIVITVFVLAGGWFAWYLAGERYHMTGRQVAELACYLAVVVTVLYSTAYRLLTKRSRREREWPHPPLVVRPSTDDRATQKAWNQSAVVLGYDVHGEPWLWPDRVRVMQAIVLGMTGSGKTTLLRNIITQDLFRVVGPPEDQHRIPMIILDGKADMEFFYSLLPHIHRAGRLGQLRVINPSRPNLSVRYNPFHCSDDNYMPVVKVLREQVTKASHRLELDRDISTLRKLNFEMSVKNLYQSFQDRERVPKIQGLLNECMTFLDDELSVITGPYEDLLSLDEVIEQELILFVTLNVNKNTEPVRALGKMLLQNLQLVVGERYESDEQRRVANRPLFSVVLDEFAPFGYRNFPQILQTARGTNTAFLFSMQSLPQLMHVGRGFKEDVASAPNTTMTLRTRDEETARYFLRASAEHQVTRRNLSMERWKFFGLERYEETGRAVDVQATETRALDEHIKNLPKGQMEILMTDDTRGTLHTHLHVRPPTDVRVLHFEPVLYPRLKQSRAASIGANLRFKGAELTDTRHVRRMH